MIQPDPLVLMVRLGVVQNSLEPVTQNVTPRRTAFFVVVFSSTRSPDFLL